MTHPANEGTPLQKIVNGITGILIVFCGIEMMPRWSMLGLDWSPATYALITAISGAASGWVSRPGYRVPGLIAGMLAGPGAIFAMYVLMHRAPLVPIPLVLMAILVGMLPAVGLYKILEIVQDTIMPPRSKTPGAPRPFAERSK